MSAAYSVSLFTDWTGETLEALGQAPGRPEPTAPGAGGASSAPAGTPGPVRLVDAPVDNLTARRGGRPVVAAPPALPHRLLAEQRGRDPVGVLRRRGARGAAALDAVRRLAAWSRRCCWSRRSAPSPPDQLWLSGSYQRDTLAIHFTWRNRPDQVDAVLPEVEAALAPFDARPHWGKVSHVPAGQPERLYPRLADARALFERLDPRGRFSNARLERLGVREAR